MFEDREIAWLTWLERPRIAVAFIGAALVSSILHRRARAVVADRPGELVDAAS